MQAYQRKVLLERVNRESATLGASIPDRITVQGEELDLREFVFEIKRRDTVPPGEREAVEEAKKNLRRERLQRLQRLEDEEAGLTFEEGEELVETIIGLDRALEALESLGSGSIEQELKAKEAADQKRWMNFLRKALGREHSRGRR